MAKSEPFSLGYVIVPHPNTAQFRSVGPNHLVSFIPDTWFAEPIGDTTICVWLGPSAGAETCEVFVFLIWPGRGLLDFSPGLNEKQSSRIIHLAERAGQFTLIPPTAIAQDLMLLNNRPCLLFIRWSREPNAVEHEALLLCSSTRVKEFLASLQKYLESVAVRGDAVLSSRIADWYRATGENLKKAARNDHLFDPTLIVEGTIGSVKFIRNQLFMEDVDMHDLRTIYPAHVDGPVVVKLLFPSPDLPQACTFIDSNGSERCDLGRQLIKKPRGQAGCLSRGGYNLKSVLSDWGTDLYKDVQEYVRARLKHYIRERSLIKGVTITSQPPTIIRQVQQEVRDKYPILAKYEDDWPSRDMIQSFLANAAYPKNAS